MKTKKKTPWANETATLMALKPGKTPQYAKKPIYISLMEDVLCLVVNWVDHKFEIFWGDGVDTAGSPGDIFYDRREYWAEERCPEHTFLHDLCHGIVARNRRADWKENTNFGIGLLQDATNEEIDTFCLQFYFMWHLLKIDTKTILDVMEDYSCFQEIDDLPLKNWHNNRKVRAEAKSLVEYGRKLYQYMLSREERGILKEHAGEIRNIDRRKTVWATTQRSRKKRQLSLSVRPQAIKSLMSFSL